jgi:cell division protein FtsB
VFAGAIGVRRKTDHERAPLNPLHLVIAAVVFAALFIFTLLTIVKLVLS